MASQAFVQVVADTSEVERDLRIQMNQIIRDVERDLPAIQVEIDVDTTDFDRALDDLIDSTRRNFRDLSDDIEVDTDRIGDSLDRNARRGRSAVDSLSDSLRSTSRDTSAFSGILSAAVPSASALASGLSAAGIAMGGLAAAALAAGAAIAAVPLAFAGIGVLVAAQSKEVQSAYKGLFKEIGDGLKDLVDPIEDSLVELSKTFSKTFKRITPELGSIFKNVSPLVEQFGEVIASVLEDLVGAFDEVVKASKPVTDSLAKGLKGLGPALAGFFTNLSKGSDGAAEGFDGLFKIINKALPAIGTLLGQIADKFGPVFNDLVDGAIKLAGGLSPLKDSFSQISQAVAPLISGGIKTLADIVQRMTPYVVDLVNAISANLGPVLASLQPLLGPLADLLVRVAQSVVQIAIKIINDLIPALIPVIDEIVNLTLQIIPLVEKALPGIVKGIGFLIDALVQIAPYLADFIKVVGGGLVIAIRDYAIPIIKTIVFLMMGDFQKAFNTATPVVSAFSRNFIRVFTDMNSGIIRTAKSIYNTLRNMVVQIDQLFRNIGSSLYNSGRAAIQGFVNGVLSQVGAVRRAVNSVIQAAKNYFPHSPAPEGPFSGRGYTSYSGEALVEGFIEGIRAQVPALQRAVSQSLGMASMALNASTGDMTTPARAMSSNVSMGNVAVAAPQVTVMIGNKVVNDHVQVLIDNNNRQRDRVASQGIRR